MKKGIFLLVAAAVVASCLIIPPKSKAMPGFARKYRFSCTVCHAPFPRLKPYGDEFAGNGFRLPEGEPPRANYDTGDNLLQLPRDLLFGMRADMMATVAPDDEPSEFDFKTPYNFKFISGGPISDKVSYYFYFYLSEGGEVAGIEDAFLYFPGVFDTGINFTVGQFALADPVAKGELRLTYEGYEIFARAPDRSHVDMKYARGVVVDYGFETGTDLVFQAVNGNGLVEADEETGSYDNDNYTNYMFRINQAIGPASLGGFYYMAKEKNTINDASTDLNINNVDYYGGDFRIGNENIEFMTVYLVRRDSNPYFMSDDEEDTETNGLLAELTVLPEGGEGKWYVSALYNDMASDYEQNGVRVMDYQTATCAVHYLISRNVRAAAEYTYIIRDLSRGEDYRDRSRYALEVIAAF